MKTESFDIVIIGGGMVGSTLACALACHTNFSIAVVEAKPLTEQWTALSYHHRVSAFSLASQRIFQAIGAWQGIKERRVSPFTSIEVWDEYGDGEIHFTCQDIASPVLGHIIENQAVQDALLDRLRQFARVEIVAPAQLTAFHVCDDHVELVTADENILRAPLAIAADGAQSWLREHAGMNIKRHAVDQEAIVSTVVTALPHQQTARQVFLSTGPLAFLPLSDPHTSSIVWSLPPVEAQSLLAMNDTDFCRALTRAFSCRLGEVMSAKERFGFPLQQQQAANYVKPRVALAGDAAHILHPLAGQGVNVGLLDAASLAEVIIEAAREQRDIGGLSVLRRYERWRRADNQVMLAGVDAIKRLFASDHPAVQVLRSSGMKFTHQFPLLKNLFTRYAVGNRSGLPKLARIKGARQIRP